MALIKCKECGHEVSKKADKCPNCGAPIKKKTSGCAWLFLIFVGYALYITTSSDTSTSSPPGSSGSSATPYKAPVDKPDVIEAWTVDPLDYRIIEINQSKKGGSINPLVTPKYLWIEGKAVLDEIDVSLITEESVKHTLTAIIEELRQKHSPDAINALLFESEVHLNNNARVIGAADWWPKGHSLSPDNYRNISNKKTYVLQFNRVSIPKNMIESDVLSKFSEIKRKKIFTEYVLAEDRAMAEAENKYPIDGSKIPMNRLNNYDWEGAFKKNDELYRKLEKKYHSQVLSKYKINRKEMEKITTEAFTENWPFP